MRLLRLPNSAPPGRPTPPRRRSLRASRPARRRPPARSRAATTPQREVARLEALAGQQQLHQRGDRGGEGDAGGGDRRVRQLDRAVEGQPVQGDQCADPRVRPARARRQRAQPAPDPRQQRERGDHDQHPPPHQRQRRQADQLAEDRGEALQQHAQVDLPERAGGVGGRHRRIIAAPEGHMQQRRPRTPARPVLGVRAGRVQGHVRRAWDLPRTGHPRIVVDGVRVPEGRRRHPRRLRGGRQRAVRVQEARGRVVAMRFTGAHRRRARFAGGLPPMGAAAWEAALRATAEGEETGRRCRRKEAVERAVRHLRRRVPSRRLPPVAPAPSPANRCRSRPRRTPRPRPASPAPGSRTAHPPGLRPGAGRSPATVDHAVGEVLWPMYLALSVTGGPASRPGA